LETALSFPLNHEIQNAKWIFLKSPVDYQFSQDADDKLVFTPT
jgi:hypothetical protein